MDKRKLLGKLPAFTNSTVLIEKRQTVRDIIKEVLAAHEFFAKDYDIICEDFECATPLETAKALFKFCKDNIRYRVEPEEKQTTKSPAAILALGDTIGGDCKHYAGFIGGVLDALNRKGCQINWCYRFASYDMFDSTPQHVFIVLFYKGREIWVDPVLSSFDQKLQPYHRPIDKRPKRSNMPLYRINGIGASVTVPQVETNESELFAADAEDPQLTPELQQAINTLLFYGVMDGEGRVSDQVLSSLSKTLGQDEFDQVSQARQLVQTAATQSAGVGSIFSSIWRGVKKVTLAVPRNAYLSLVMINAFGMATKLKAVIWNKDGSENFTNTNRLRDLWVNKFAGTWKNLVDTVKSGAKKGAILGASDSSAVGAAPAALPAWVAIASALIAAIGPVIKDCLNKSAQAGVLDPSIDPLTGLPYGMNTGDLSQYSSGGGVMDFINRNPLVVVAGAAGLVLLLTRKKGGNA